MNARNAAHIEQARAAGIGDRNAMGRNGYNAHRYGNGPGDPGWDAYGDGWVEADRAYAPRPWCEAPDGDETLPDYERLPEDDWRKDR